jgi:arabinose-5-phosphate isomerase
MPIAVLGSFTDGDLRRLVEKGEDLRSRRAADVMQLNPRTVREDGLAAEAAAQMGAVPHHQLVVEVGSVRR